MDKPLNFCILCYRGLKYVDFTFSGGVRTQQREISWVGHLTASGTEATVLKLEGCAPFIFITQRFSLTRGGSN